MGFEITALNKSEIDVYNDAVWQAFGSVPDNLSLCLYPGGFSEPIQAYMHEGTQSNLSDPSFSLIAVRDSESSEILAVACWYFQTKNKSLEEVLEGEAAARKERAEQEPITGINFTAISDFREAQAKAKREILGGRAHVLLKVLATYPAAQRRGAGAAALAWGLGRADDMGLPAYLEASSMGRPLYAKFGFNEVSPKSQVR